MAHSNPIAWTLLRTWHLQDAYQWILAGTHAPARNVCAALKRAEREGWL